MGGSKAGEAQPKDRERGKADRQVALANLGFLLLVFHDSQVSFGMNISCTFSIGLNVNGLVHGGNSRDVVQEFKKFTRNFFLSSLTTYS